MSWIERMLEERLAQAARTGELDVPALAGRPIPDLDQPRRQGWWAEQFVARERSHDRRVALEAELARVRSRFWRASTERELDRLVGEANDMIDSANRDLGSDDRVARFDPNAIRARWRALRRQRLEHRRCQ